LQQIVFEHYHLAINKNPDPAHKPKTGICLEKTAIHSEVIMYKNKISTTGNANSFYARQSHQANLLRLIVLSKCYYFFLASICFYNSFAIKIFNIKISAAFAAAVLMSSVNYSFKNLQY
jgi:hypothetical protein